MTEKVSDLGRYSGFTTPIANGYVRSSEYVEVDDGCRIAIDLLRPAKDGVEIDGPLPTIVQATGYRRAYFFGQTDLALVGDQPAWKKLAVGDLVTGYEKSELAKRLVDHGYNLVCIDLRGTGASFGTTSRQMWRNSADIAQIVDWIAQQMWATDKVGMIGISWEGTIQLTTAAYHPKHLTAIAPMATSQGFSAVCDGGLMLHGFYAVDWANMVADQHGQAPALPVDGNMGPALMAQAVAERVNAPEPGASDDPLAAMKMVRDPMLEAVRANAPPPPLSECGPLRDSMDETARINASGTAILLISGWWDISFSGHALDFFRALKVPKRMLMGPWNHLGPIVSSVEQHRWFDYWLKGIENGIKDEPCFNFAETDAFGRDDWASAPGYPLPESQKIRYALSGAAELTDQSDLSNSEIDYQVDYSVTLGDHSRSRFFFRKDRRIKLGDLNERAKKCLTFMTSTFQSRIRLNGRAELFAYLKTSGQSGALVATLEEVLADGRAQYITEGAVNFFHRRISNSQNPHDGRAFHSQEARDLIDVKPNELMEIGVEFYPVGWKVTPGSRIRLTLAGADADNFLILPETPPPLLSVLTGGEPASHLLLPIVSSEIPSSTVEAPNAKFEGQHARAFEFLEPPHG